MVTTGVIRFSKCYSVCTSNSDLKDNLSNINTPRSQGVSRGRRGAGGGGGPLLRWCHSAPLLTGGDCPTLINQLKQEVTTCFTRVGVVTGLLKKEEDKR